MKKINKIFRILFFTGFVIIFAWVSLNLFFGHQVNDFLASDDKEDEQIGADSLGIIYPDPMVEINPFSSNLSVRQRLVNIYEPLVVQDENLNLKPSLAISWGVIDKTTWEFHVRSDVEFHDGSDFDTEDIVASIERAQDSDKSEMVELVDDIDKIEVVDELSFFIHTDGPDPLLLNKLSLVPMISSDEGDEFLVPNGTGPYEFSSWEKGQELLLKRNNSYWGQMPKFENLELLTRVDISLRVNDFLKDKGEVLTFVPFDAVKVLEEKEVEMISIPTLEVQFLLFNMDSEILSDVAARRAVFASVDREGFVKKIGSFAKKVDQYVSDGVFGYNSGIELSNYSLKNAKRLVSEAELIDETLKLNLPVGMDVLGEQLRNDFNKVSINLIVSYLEVPDLLQSMEDRDADIYFLGFKSTLGDAAEFFDSVVRSGADFNVGRYSNPGVDYLIDIALSEFSQRVRLEAMKEAAEIIVNEDYIGIPLFEYEKVYAFSDEVSWEQRVDGLIYPDDIEIK